MSATMASERECRDALKLYDRAIWWLARRLAPRGQAEVCDADDLASIGRMAALRAVGSYEPGCGASERTWVVGKARYAMIDALRALHGRRMQRILPIDDRVVGEAGDEVTRLERVPVASQEPAVDARLTVAALLALLSPQEREVVSRHHLDGERLHDIGASFGFGESRTSQVLTAAMARMREVAMEQKIVRHCSGCGAPGRRRDNCPVCQANSNGHAAVPVVNRIAALVAPPERSSPAPVRVVAAPPPPVSSNGVLAMIEGRIAWLEAELAKLKIAAEVVRDVAGRPAAGVASRA